MRLSGRKKEIPGSISPEKMNFDGFHFQTCRMNEAIRLNTLMDADFTGNKNGQTEENLDLSACVARPGFEPRQIEPKSIVLPLYYRAIRCFSGVF